jgi:hypothetical protein
MRRRFVALAAPVLAAPVLAVSLTGPLITTAGGSSPVARAKPTIATPAAGSTGTRSHARPAGRRWN